MRNLAAFGTAILLVLHEVSLAAGASEPVHLDANELLSGIEPSAVIDNRAFVPGTTVRPARAPFNGDLVLSEAVMQTVPVDLKFRAAHGKDPRYFPAARLSFITVDGDLVPTTQDVIRSGFAPGGRSYWDLIVQPGRVWSEPADGGWSRAAFPFALVNSLEGETHNGLAIFLYRGNEVSALRFQVVQQTLPGNVEAIFTAAGRVPAHAEPGAPAGPTAMVRRYRAAKADEIPIRPWADLERQVGGAALAGFADGLPAKDTVLSGLDYRGTFYLYGCESAGGPLPWCDRARFGVWSVTKSFINETALLRLAQKYGPEVFKAKIVDYVPAARSYPAWANVTFDDCINMATGLGNGSTRREPNDISDGYLDVTYNDWYDAESKDDKLSALLHTAHVYPWGPGQVARYRDQDMYILGVAMDAFIKMREGPNASLWSMIQREVYAPIGIHYATTSRTMEPLGEGIPLMGFGVYATIGELVKVARLYHAHGRWHGSQILYAPRIEELKAGTSTRGLPSGDHSPFGETRYYNAFWHIRYDANEGCKLYIPQMLGWGSNTVALYPGGLTGIRIAHLPSDSTTTDDPTPMARVANRLVSFCE
jgi:hypothetical protein